MGDLVVVQVRGRRDYAPELLVCQVEHSADGTAPPQEAIGKSVMPSALNTIPNLASPSCKTGHKQQNTLI
jgi:hypothetical protein